MKTKHPPPPPRQKRLTEADLGDLTEEFFDLLLELNGKANHLTPAGLRLEQMIGKALKKEQKRRNKKGRTSVETTLPANSVQFQPSYE